ncbi:MAG: exodeoxyribonuclease VII large subunit [Armatimonadota bacterium]
MSLLQSSGVYIFSVHEVTRYVKTVLERERPLQGVLVRGEISNCKYHTSGHLYFTLKDDFSQLPCVMWRDRVQALPIRCADGMKVIAEGSVTVYERGGQYQLSVASVQAEGVGNLYLAFEQLKRKLEGEGLFAEGRKRPLPTFPRRIALLTSPTGAVAHDFVTVSTRRWRGRRIVLVPTPVQGAQAPAGIVRSLKQACEIPGVDVIVLARGGGSFEELAAFNDEAVARAIADSPLPVVSAIGHETDYTIADFVADLRAATPSAAAELVVPDLRGVADYLQTMQQRILLRLRQRIDMGKREVDRVLAQPVLRNPRILTQERQQALDHVTERIHERFRARVAAAGQQLQGLEDRIAALDPHGVLLRGYALVKRPADDSLVPSAALAKQEKLLEIQFFDGAIRAVPTGE